MAGSRARTFKILLAAWWLSVGLAGCGGSPAPATLTLWTSWTEASASTLQQVVNSYEHAHPNVHITIHADNARNLATDFAQAASPTQASLLLAPARDFLDSTLQQRLSPLGKSLTGSGQLKSTPAWALPPGSAAQWTYAPVAFDEDALLYRPSLMHTPPATITDLLSQSARYQSQGIQALTVNDNLSYTFPYLMAGANPSDTLQVGAARDASAWLTLLARLNASPAVSITNNYEASDYAFRTSNAASFITLASTLPHYLALFGDDVAAAPLPSVPLGAPFGYGGATASGSEPAAPFVLMTGIAEAAGLSAAQRTAADSFVLSLTGGAAQNSLWTNGGLPPVYPSGATARDQSVVALQTIAAAGLPFPPQQEYQLLFTPSQQAETAVLTGQQSPAKAGAALARALAGQ